MGNERLRYADTFHDPNLPVDMETNAVLREALCATELLVAQTVIPTMVSLEIGISGCQESLVCIAPLVEPVIAD